MLSRFDMSEPAEMGMRTRYSFSITAENSRLLEYVRQLPGIASVLRIEDDTVIVNICDDWCHEDVWLSVYNELQTECKPIDINPIWDF